MTSCDSLPQLWKLPFAQVIFDSDPAMAGKTPDQQSKEMSRAMIRSVTNFHCTVCAVTVYCVWCDCILCVV